LEANHDCTIIWYKKSMLWVKMTKFSSNCTQIQIVGLFLGWQEFTKIQRREQNFQDSATHGKIAVIVDQSWSVITAKSAHGVARTSPRRLDQTWRISGYGYSVAEDASV